MKTIFSLLLLLSTFSLFSQEKTTTIEDNKILAAMYAVGVNYLAGGAEYFIQQQALSKQQAFGYSYTPWAYQFRHRKMAIWSYKSLMYGFTGKIAK